MDIALIEKFYDVKVRDLFLLDRHFGTGIYLMDAEEGKYIVKVLPVCVENVDREGMIAEYLWKHGLKVARFLKNKDGSFSVKTSENQFTVQQYIEGHTLPVNSAPEWVLNETADYLAEAIRLLQAYEGLPRRFGKEFFSKETVIAKKAEYEKELDLARTLGGE